MALQIAFPLESDVKCMDPSASAEACKAAESATNIALVRPCSIVATGIPSMLPYLSRCLHLDWPHLPVDPQCPVLE